MRAHLFQYDIAWEDKAANHATVRRLGESVSAGIAAGDLIVLPEMFDTGFSLRVEATADAVVVRAGEAIEPGEPIGPSLGFVMALARHHACWVVAGITVMVRGLDGRPHANERGEPMGVNRAVLIDPDGHVAAFYDKVHPFSFGREGERFLPGPRVVTHALAAGGGVGVPMGVCPVVCYDLRFPELFRAGLSGRPSAEVFAVIANWPEARAGHWRALCVARAIENQAFVLGVNRVGRDPQLGYAGGSLIVDPMGQVLAEAAASDAREPLETVVSAALDVAGLRAWRDRFPAVRDRRRWDAGEAGGLVGRG